MGSDDSKVIISEEKTTKILMKEKRQRIGILGEGSRPAVQVKEGN